MNTPDPAAVDSVKVVTIRTEKMYDKLDLNYLGLQMRQSGKKIYGLTSEFACPLIVHVYMDPSENPDRDWFKDMVEMKVLSMPVHGGGTKDTEVDFEFVDLEDSVSYIPTESRLSSGHVWKSLRTSRNIFTKSPILTMRNRSSSGICLI